MARIGVEQSLSDVRDALQQKGYDVVDLKSESDAKNCDCCVVTGMDSNIMGVSSSFTAGPVIQASGLSADEICNQVDSKLNNQ